jgi:hypothetical protein
MIKLFKKYKQRKSEKEAISTAHNLVDEYLEAINYTRLTPKRDEKQQM